MNFIPQNKRVSKNKSIEILAICGIVIIVNRDWLCQRSKNRRAKPRGAYEFTVKSKGDRLFPGGTDREIERCNNERLAAVSGIIISS